MVKKVLEFQNQQSSRTAHLTLLKPYLLLPTKTNHCSNPKSTLITNLKSSRSKTQTQIHA
ncbi:hypothetical protein COLO4_24979 [Corchorus olitorius]|uniref:Uncharacterized protein n=1 Tax=Corchorus olitorius TaxID=93759 RepID=A0A1R3I5K2_9ROSI|nr:hypothetical protein COLO4_24979 [Corchorus olitorius]